MHSKYHQKFKLYSSKYQKIPIFIYSLLRGFELTREHIKRLQLKKPIITWFMKKRRGR